jgi:DNA replication protein DnaC
LKNINENKRKIYENNIISKCDKCSITNTASCDKCVLLIKIIYRYAEANIPLDFWSRNIDQFQGDPKLVKLYNVLTKDLKDTYENGYSFILKGKHGTGKTYFASMTLKRIVEKGYSGLYTTLSDVVDVLLHADYKAKSSGNRELKNVDFLVLDEFDSRFIGSESSGMLFGKILESIIRIRLQNKMPTILITNDPDPTKALGAALGESLTSLISGYMKEIYVTGRDFRKGDK